MKPTSQLLLVALLGGLLVQAQAPPPARETSTIAARTQALQKKDGFLPTSCRHPPT